MVKSVWDERKNIGEIPIPANGIPRRAGSPGAIRTRILKQGEDFFLDVRWFLNETPLTGLTIPVPSAVEARRIRTIASNINQALEIIGNELSSSAEEGRFEQLSFPGM